MKRKAVTRLFSFALALMIGIQSLDATAIAAEPTNVVLTKTEPDDASTDASEEEDSAEDASSTESSEETGGEDPSNEEDSSNDEDSSDDEENPDEEQEESEEETEGVEVPEEEPAEEIEEEDEKIVGENGDFTYTTSGDGVTITKYTGEDTVVIVPETIDGKTVKKIGDSAFKESSITKVELSDSITTIGNYSFQNCKSLDTVKLPDKLVTLGYYTFSGCISLTGITLPNQLKTVGSSCFSGCTQLESITIPASLTSVDSNAFNSVKKAIFSEGITKVPNYCFYGAGDLTEVVFADSITEIGGFAFYDCTSLQAITLPDELKTLESSAFFGCTSLSGVTLPDQLAKVGYNCFAGCTQLESITIPASLTSVDSNAFNSVKKVIFSEGITKVPNYCFYGSSNLTEIVFADTITEIGSNAFYNCKSLQAVTLPDKLIKIDSYAFNNCESLASISFPETLTTIEYYAFSYCKALLSVTLPKSLTSCGSSAFPLVQKVTFADGIKVIPANILNGSSSLTEVVIPNTVTEIGNSAFYNCGKLEAVHLPQNLVKLGDSSFSRCALLSEIEFPQTLTSVGSSCFSGCSALESITLPKTITTIGSNAFSSVKKAAFEEGTVAIPKYAFSGANGLTEVTIPESVTLIGSYAFNNCSMLAEVTLPAKTETIESHAFYGCSLLEKADLPKSLTKLDSHAFYNCKALKTVELPESLKEVGNNCFYGCIAITELTVPDKMTLMSNAFRNCTALKKLTLGDEVVLKGYTFAGIKEFEEIVFGKDVSFSNSDFYDLVKKGTEGNISWEVADLSMGSLVLTGDGAIPGFSGDEKPSWFAIRPFVKELVFDGNITAIGNQAFEGMDKLEYVILSDAVKTIGENAFKGCKSLEYAELSESLESVSDCAFAECDAMNQLVFKSPTAPSLSRNAFGTEPLFKAYFPFTGIGYTNYMKSKYPTIVWKDYDDTSGCQEITLVLDVSGSMSGSRIAGLKVAANAFVENVGGIENFTKISIVQYNSSAKKVSDFTFYQKGLQNKINALKDSGGTNYYNALTCADGVLSNGKGKHQYLVMFSDGEPNDNKDNIYALSDELRVKYGIFTVGLGTSKNQRAVLERIAGSENRYFEAKDVDALIAIFKDLAKDIEREDTSKVEAYRNERWLDVKNNLIKYVFESKEDTTIKVTPSLGIKGAAKYVLGQAGNKDSEMTSTDGEFFFVPGEVFVENYSRDTDTIDAFSRIYIDIYDADDNLLETIDTQIAVTDGFIVTYNMNGGRGAAHKQTVKPWEDFKYDGPEPSRKGYYFDKWYENENGEGAYDYFSSRNYKSRYCIENDITVYANWREKDFDPQIDAWGFGNARDVFCTSNKDKYDADEKAKPHRFVYEILDADYVKLVENNKGSFAAEQKSRWGGSCFGMSATSIFYNDNLLEIQNFDASKSMPYSVKAGDMRQAKVKDTTQSDSDVFDDTTSIESLINYYYLLQMDNEVNDVRQAYKGKWFWTEGSESSNIEGVIKKCQDNKKPVLLGIQINPHKKKIPGQDKVITGGHAVVLYDFHELATDSYEGKIYDCANNSKEYTVLIHKNSNGHFVFDCPDWVTDWGDTQIFIKYALTTQEIADKTNYLVAPDEVLVGATETAESKYTLETNYPDFVISNGSKSATISNGQVTSGDLHIEEQGEINDVDSPVRYGFVLPDLGDNEKYTITDQSGISGTYDTSLYNSADDGFYSSAESENPGIVVFSSNGEVDTTYTEKGTQTLYVTNPLSTMPWDNLTVIAKDTGIEVENAADYFHVTTKTPQTTADITVKGIINKAEFDDLMIPEGGVYITADGDNAIVKDKDGNIIGTKLFGYSVVFDSKGGSAVPSILNLPTGSLVTEPEEPTKEGFIFEGWFKNEECTTVWNFNEDKVTENTVIYAGWSINENYFKTVTFVFGKGAEDQKIHVIKGGTISLDQCPDIPNIDEQNWYKDEKRTVLWDFDNDTVDTDTTLYAEIERFTVTFTTGTATEIPSQRVPVGVTATAPGEILTKEGFTFCGWYADEKYSKEWNFEADVVTKDTDLFAKWVENRKDINDTDTGVSIEIVRPYDYAYTGKAIQPKVMVRDGDKVLKAKTDYKISFKNNTNVCDLDTTTLPDNKKPQVIIQGVGSYKNAKTLVAYFSIYQADMANMNITLPTYVAVKSGNKKQYLSPVVKNGASTVNKKLYTVNYYTNEALTTAVDGITEAGNYYVVIEAKKTGENYEGNYCGKSQPIKVVVAGTDKLVSKMKVTYKSGAVCVSEALTEKEVIQKLITKVTIGKLTYKTDEVGYDGFNRDFKVTITNNEGKTFEGEELWKGIEFAGNIDIKISAREDNQNGFVGEIQKTYTVKGTALKANMFTLTYDRNAAKPVNKTVYDGNTNTPYIFSELKDGVDYEVTYLSGKKTLTADEVVNAGSYKAVIKGKNKYTGSVSLSFTINKLNIATAYADKKITVKSSGSAVYSMTGAKPVITVSHASTVLAENTDYTVSYSGNKAVSARKKYGSFKITGKGNFTGTIAGTGASSYIDNAPINKGKTAACNFSVNRKPLSSTDITIVVNKLTFKKGKVSAVSFKLMDNGKAISSSEYSSTVSSNTSTATLTIRTRNKNFSGSRTERISVNLISVADKKKVTAELKDKDTKIYYTGEQITPEIVVTDANGNDISDKVTVTYGKNTGIGSGSITVSGIASKGYYGTKTIKFTILPKWARWIFK